MCSKKRRGRSHWVHSPLDDCPLLSNPLPKSLRPPTLFLKTACFWIAVCVASPHMCTLSNSTIVHTIVIMFFRVYGHGYTWLLIWAVGDSTLLPGRSLSFSPKCLPLQATVETHTQFVIDRPVPWPQRIPLPLCQVDSVTVVFPQLWTSTVSIFICLWHPWKDEETKLSQHRWPQDGNQLFCL